MLSIGGGISNQLKNIAECAVLGVEVTAVAVLSESMGQRAADAPGTVTKLKSVRSSVESWAWCLPLSSLVASTDVPGTRYLPYIPFVVEQLGRLGPNAEAFLRALAVRAAGSPGSELVFFQPVGFFWNDERGARARPPLEC